MYTIIGILLFIASMIGGLYVGGWLLFIQPILDACKAFDEGILTGSIVVITVVKCVCASTVGWLIFAIGTCIGKWFIEKDM